MKKETADIDLACTRKNKMGKLKRKYDNYVYSGVRFQMKDYEKMGDHIIKKFELISEYTKGWA